METEKIYNESNLETMSRMPDNFINLTVTSPPYNMNLRIRNGEYCSRQIVKNEFSTKYDTFDDNLPVNDFYKIHSEILKEILRVSKITFYNIQLVTGSKRAFFKIIGEFNEHLKEIIVWDKVNAEPAMKYNLLNSQHELILIFGDNPISRQFSNVNFKRGTLSNTWRIKRGKKIDKTHGAVFPEELIHKIITNFSNEGDLIYDPFMGSGTTGKVAQILNRRWIGSEISSEYTEMAIRRIKTVQNTLF